MAQLTFWFEFASTYSYLAAMRIEDLASKAGVEIVWKPFLLGPVFKAQGWDTSPFNLYPAKGKYMVRDIERTASARGLTFRLPNPFPQNGLAAARLALAGLDEGWTPDFVKAVYRAEFAEGRDIADRETLVRAAGADARGGFRQGRDARNQGPAACEHRRGAGHRYFRCPKLYRGRRRAILGRRQARTSFGVERPITPLAVF